MIVIYLIFILVLAAMLLGAMELALKHQRELATLRGGSADEQIAALERKIDDLTQLVYQQTIALDVTHRPTAPEPLAERIGV